MDSNIFWNLWNGILLKFEMIIKLLENQVEESIQLKSNNQESLIRNPIEAKSELDQEDYQINQEEMSEFMNSNITILSKFNPTFFHHQTINLTSNEIQSLVNQLLSLICKVFSSLCERYGLVVQDLIRDLEGIPWILRLNEFNPDYPYLSEHSLFCIRNLLVQNVKNQTFIQSLKESKSKSK
ncbi:uncharacterized protein MELLADRAFT_76976 [Melampsora larici-populina 98AG31]|uniref:Ataxin-10 homolog n=1 Tax=Melampsora larici-populina (strain 98AG31 / pathotype 3-4-7) TaxID=747676 RepID=F4RBU3_MELLP|nr:uncharacterized protein MELLADRAFT_76976 [Melampsora larici-populina 98AG31]EGG10166.1 hypothetical protein MELLADRAFT_76976 [Melampsora larici-populina 98AG31]